jgi:parvulin-like peptidyl-prolyl isomerase
VKIKYGITLLIGLAAFTSSGCEQIEKLFPKKEEKKAVSPAAKAEPKKISGDVIARVGGWTLTREEFTERLDALKEAVPDYNIEDEESRRLVLEELVRQQLLVEDAKKTGVDKSRDIQEAVEEFRRTLIVREVARVKTENITVSDKEARDFYEQNRNLMVDQLQLRAGEIVVAEKSRADAILIELLQGGDFATIARESSIAASAADGGDLGFITEVPFAEMGNALMALDAGEVSGVFRGPQGFYIVKVIEKSGGQPIPFEKIKDEIIQNQMMVKQQQAILDYIDQLRETIPVEVNENLL